jgi:hypothetical protein
VIDRVVGAAALDALLSRTMTELGGQGLPLRALTRNGTVRLYTHERVVAVIHASRAAVVGHTRRARGNFLVGGEHWDTVRSWLAAARLEPRPAAPAPHREPIAVVKPPRLRGDFPSGVSKMLRRRAVAASVRLRNDRNVEFGHVVVLLCGKETVRFSPIPDSGPPRVPFIYERGDERLEGAIRLRARNDPMAVEAPVDVDEELLAAAWARALMGYAELTCVSASTLAISGQLRPTRATHRLLASYVVGHIRHLAGGATPGDAAVAHAEHIGVALGPHQTWVRPHARGVPADAELVFGWQLDGADTHPTRLHG